MMWLSLIVEILEMRVPPSFFLSLMVSTFHNRLLTSIFLSPLTFEPMNEMNRQQIQMVSLVLL